MATRTELLRLAALGQKARAEWTHAAKKGLGFALLVKKNNPHKTMDEIMARKDVQAALDHATDGATQKAQDAIIAAWHDAGGDPNSPYLAKLLSDSERNGADFGQQAMQTLQSDDPSSLKDLVSKYGYRQAAGEAVAETRAHNESLLADIVNDGHERIRWRTTSDDPCPNCVALDGYEVNVGEEFPDLGPRPLGVFIDLTMPPRHPNCRCIVEPVD